MIVQNTSTFEGHIGAIYALSTAFDAGEFFSGAADGYLVKWQINQPETGVVLLKLDSPIYTICKFYHHSQKIALGTANGNITIFDLISNQIIIQLKAHEGAVFDLKMLGNQLLSAGADGVVNAWELDAYKKQFQLNFSNKSARVIAPGLNNADFYVGYSDHTIRFFSGTNKPELKNDLLGHTQSVFALAVHPNTGVLVSGGRDAYLRFWQNHQTTANIPAHLSHINSLAFNPGSKLLASASMDKSIKIWNPETAQLLKVIDQTKLKAHKHSVNKICWLSATQFISCSDDRSIYLWDINEDELN